MNYFEKFMVITDCGKLTIAAEKLGISQPALSDFITSLEKNLKVKLLIRNRSGVTPTHEGLIFYDFCREVLYKEKELKRKLDQKDGKVRNLSIGLIDNLAITSIVQTLNETVLPKYEFSILIDNSNNLIDMVLSGKIDYAVVAKNPKEYLHKLLVEEFLDDEFILVYSHKILEPVAGLHSLIRKKVITYNRNSNTFKLIDSKFKELNFSPHYFCFSTNPEIIKMLVVEDSGIGYLPKNFISNELKKGLLKEVPVHGAILERKFYLIRRKDCEVDPRDLIFLDKLKQKYLIN